MSIDASSGQAAKADRFERQAHGERTRERIIASAVELFASRGYRGTGVGALAKRVRMTGAGLLYYFGSKERLLLEVVAERDRVDEIEQHDLLTLETMGRAGEHAVSTALITQLFIVLGGEAIEDEHPLHDFFVERYERRRRLARQILRKEIHAGRMRADVDIDQLAIEIPATILGMEMQWLTDREAFDLAAAVENYATRLAAEIAAG